ERPLQSERPGLASGREPLLRAKRHDARALVLRAVPHPIPPDNGFDVDGAGVGTFVSGAGLAKQSARSATQARGRCAPLPSRGNGVSTCLPGTDGELGAPDTAAD